MRIRRRLVSRRLPARSTRLEHLEPRTLMTGSPYGFLTGPNAGTPLQIAVSYLAAHGQEIGITPADLTTMAITDQYTDATGARTTHLYLRQTYNGLPVGNVVANVNISRKGEVINVGGGFVGNLAAQSTGVVTAPGLSASQALLALAPTLGLPLQELPVVEDTQPGPAQPTVLRAPGLSLDPIPARLQYIATGGGGVALSWDFVLRTPDGAHWYDASVDAGTGVVTDLNDWANDLASYRVYGTPTRDPGDGPRTLLTDPSDPIASPYGWHDTNGVTGAEFTLTRGNNANAYEDSANANTPGFQPDGKASLTFDYPLDLTGAPNTYRPAAITNLFYWTNVIHDIHYQYGFNEASGNFQVNNYGRGGVGGDEVQAEAQDGSGVDNANFATPPDGSQPRMQMYVWNTSNPNRDGDLDADVIVHEYGHGVSTRLTGGPSNSNSLNAQQSGGMAEGWSDWWSMMFTMKPTDTATSARSLAVYAYGSNLRRQPYSYDLNVDSITFDAYNGGFPNNEVHNAGEIWASALWDFTWLLIQKYGFDANLAKGYTGPGSAGNLLALQLVMDALKLQPANPSFIDARNALLLADQALTGGQNVEEIWKAFARRGLGASASTSGANSLVVVTATDVPFLLVQAQIPAGLVAGQLASDIVVGTFSDPFGSPLSAFTTQVDWGDGTAATAGTVVSLGGGNYQVKGTHTYTLGGTFRLSVRVSDLIGHIASDTVTVPVFSEISLSPVPLQTTEGLTVTRPVAVFTDSGGSFPASAYTTTIDWGDGTAPTRGTLVTLAAGFQINGTHAYRLAGVYNARVTAVRTGTGSVIDVTATIADAALVATSVPAQATEGASFSGVVAHFTDANALAQLPDYTTTINWGDGSATSTGTVVVSPGGGYDVRGTHTYQKYGVFSVLTTIVSPGGTPSSARSPMNVDDAAIQVTSRAIAATEGAVFTTVVANLRDDNPFGTASEFTADIDWGDGVLGTGTIAGPPGGPYTVTAGHTYGRYGTYSVTITVDSAGGSSGTVTRQVVVADAPLAPFPTPITAREGISFNGLVGSFRDANPGGRVGEFSAMIHWGDGATTQGTITAGSGGLFNVSGTHTYGEGSFPLAVDVQSVGGSTTTIRTNVVVPDAALTPRNNVFSPSEGIPFTGTVGSFLDGNPISVSSDFRATIDWGDGSPIETGTILFIGGRYEVQGSHAFRSGRWTVTVAVAETDNTGGTTITSTATVADAPITAAPIVFTPSEGIPFSGVVAHFTDSNPLGTVSQFTATIDWGDGSAASTGSIVAAAGGGFDVQGSHTFAFGPTTVRVTVLSDGGNRATTTLPLTVPNAPLSATAFVINPLEGQSFTGTVATLIDGNPAAVASEYTATIAWGDGKSSRGTVVPAGLPGQFRVQGTHTFDQGTYGLTVTIRDAGGGTAQASSNVSVANAPLFAAGTDLTATEGSAVTGKIATLTDGNPSALASEYVVTINWGDNSPLSTGTVVVSASGTGFDVKGTHTYPTVTANPQSFPIQVTIRDAAGGSALATATARVANAAIQATGRPNLKAIEGAPFTGTVATFVDANPLGRVGDYAATINWNDGTPVEAGTITALANDAGFAVAGKHALPVGSFTATVTITDGLAPVSAQAVIAVANAPITTAAVAVKAQQNVRFTGPIATFTDGNLSSKPGDYVATINWGTDGGTTSGTLESLGDGQFRIVGSYQYPDIGRYNLRVTLDDGQGVPITIVGSATVADAPLTPVPALVTATETLPFQGPIGTLLDGNLASLATDFLATVDWGDGSAPQAVALTKSGAGTLQLAGGHTFARSGTFTVRIQVTNRTDGGSATILSTAIIANRLYPLSGAMEASSDTGVSTRDGVTRLAQPAFAGLGEPGATVTLVGQPLDAGGTAVMIGTAVADALGRWRIVPATPLADGRYAVTGSAADSGGLPSSTATTLLGSGAPLVVDTAGPHVATIVTSPTTGEFTIFYQDSGGLSLPTVLNPASYSLFSAKNGPRRSFPLVSLAPGQALPGGFQSVVARFNPGRMRGGYVLRIGAAGTADLAGNTLDERVYTPFPSIARQPGSDYIAQIDVSGTAASGPRPYVPPPQVLAAQQFQRFLGNVTYRPTIARSRRRR